MTVERDQRNFIRVSRRIDASAARVFDAWVDPRMACRWLFTPQGDQVRLVLTQRRLADRAAMAGVSGGWHAHLRVLVDRLNDREPAAFWSIWAETDGAYEKRFADQ